MSWRCWPVAADRDWNSPRSKERVTLNGKPLAGVVVKFYPDRESNIQLPIATGTTDEGGFYQLNVSKQQPGAVVGPSTVVVKWPVRDPPPRRRLPMSPYRLSTRSLSIARLNTK